MKNLYTILSLELIELKKLRKKARRNVNTKLDKNKYIQEVSLLDKKYLEKVNIFNSYFKNNKFLYLLQ